MIRPVPPIGAELIRPMAGRISLTALSIRSRSMLIPCTDSVPVKQTAARSQIVGCGLTGGNCYGELAERTRNIPPLAVNGFRPGVAAYRRDG